jgi:hypothetical protein
LLSRKMPIGIGVQDIVELHRRLIF